MEAKNIKSKNGTNSGDVLMNEEKFVETLRDIKDILDDAGAKYWLEFGTLLGAARNRKFIPWDTDIDLGIMCAESNKIIRKIPEFEQKGFKVDITDKAFYIFRDPVVVDISLYRLRGDQAWRLHNKKTPKFEGILRYFHMLADRIIYRNLSSKMPLREKIVFALIPSFADHAIRKFLFKINVWFGAEYDAFVVPKFYYEKLDSLSFYGMKFNVPSHVHEFLSLQYGENWMEPDPN